MEPITLSRESLYQLVWTESLPSLAKKFNTTYNDLRKICVNMQIPLPKAGHWDKVRVGKPVVKVELPADYSGEQQVTLPPQLSKQQAANLATKNAQKEINERVPQLATVPAVLTNPDKLVLAAQKTLQKQKPNEYDRYKGLVHTSRDQIRIGVTSHNVSRALRIFGTLIKLLRARGHDIDIRNGETYAVLYGSEAKINMRERTKRVEAPGSHYGAEYHPTGILCFRMDTFPGKEWYDGKLPLEKQLHRIIPALEEYGKQWERWRIEAQEEKRRRQEKERIKQEIVKRKQDELSAFKELLQRSDRYTTVINLRRFIDEFERNVSSSDRLTDELREWISWARKKADWYDPFIEAKDELLDEVDKQTLVLTAEKGVYF